MAELMPLMYCDLAEPVPSHVAATSQCSAPIPTPAGALSGRAYSPPTAVEEFGVNRIEREVTSPHFAHSRSIRVSQRVLRCRIEAILTECFNCRE